MFYDLNIRKPDSPNWVTSLESIIERLIKYGYKGFGITTETNETELSKKESVPKKKGPGRPEPYTVTPQPPDLKHFRSKYPNVHFYNRINIIVGDNANIRKFITCANLKKYDLVSFQPESQAVLKALTGVAEVDIISYNPECKCELSFNRKLYNQFVNQNVYFELMYAPAIRDATARKNVLSLSHRYHAVGKSKNIVVTSGALMAHHVRGPYDVINFNLLFGLSEEQSKSSISRTCEKLILRARKQRRSKSTIEMVRLQPSNLMEVARTEALLKEET